MERPLASHQEQEEDVYSHWIPLDFFKILKSHPDCVYLQIFSLNSHWSVHMVTLFLQPYRSAVEVIFKSVFNAAFDKLFLLTIRAEMQQY